MMVVIRITGNVNLNSKVRETLERLRLRKKYSCIVINPSREQLGMIHKVMDFVSFGEIKKEMLEKLIEKRGQLIDKKKKINVKEVVEKIEEGEGYESLNLKPFFRLHPPRKGIDAKKHFGVGKGVLGNNKEHINELIERML